MQRQEKTGGKGDGIDHAEIPEPIKPMRATNKRRSNGLINEIIIFLLIYFSSFSATVTAYSPANLDPRWGGVARWTGQTPVVGVTAACPEEWAREWIHVQNYGLRRCDDTPRTGWYVDEGNVAPHIDLFLGSQEEALRHGIETMQVWKTNSPPQP